MNINSIQIKHFSILYLPFLWPKPGHLFEPKFDNIFIPTTNAVFQIVLGLQQLTALTLALF